MPVNFGQLQQIAPGQVLGQIAPQQSGGGDDLGGLLSGILGVFGGITGAGKGGEQMSQNPPGINPAGPQVGYTASSMGQGPALNTTPRLQQVVEQNSVFQNAMKTLGLKEGQGSLSAYLAKANPNLDPSKTPWCAGYVGSVLNASGLKGTGSLMAKSYLNYGTPTNTPSQGDIVVLNRGSDPNFGHVGFVQSFDKDQGVVHVLGGNQDNSVSVKQFPVNQVAGFRTPPSAQQVQQFAKDNGIQNPQQLSNITSQANPNTQQSQYPTHQLQQTQQFTKNNSLHDAMRLAGNTNQSNSIAQPMPSKQSDLDHVMAGIAGVESGGAKNPYALISKASRNGDRAYGKYQIMGNNIPSWSREALGYPVSRDQFLNNPDLQEQIAKFHINKNLQKYGPEDTASVWFSGRPAKKAGNSRDVYGTTVPEYINKFNKGYLKSKSQYANQIGPVSMNAITAGPNGDFKVNDINHPVYQGDFRGGYMSEPANTQYQIKEYNPPIGDQYAMGPGPVRLNDGTVIPNIRAFDKNTPIRDLSPQEIEVIMRMNGSRPVG